MKTSVPISLISYNTEDFLKLKLDDMIENQIIFNYVYIKHDADVDALKDHIHLTIFPTDRIDTLQLKSYFSEPCDDIKPLGISPVINKCSNTDTMFLYYIHDEKFLNSVNEVRNIYNYPIECLHYSDVDHFTSIMNNAFKFLDNISIKVSTKQIIEAIDGGISYKDFLKKYNPPTNQIQSIKVLYDSFIRSDISKLEKEKREAIIELSDYHKRLDNPFVRKE